MEPIVKVAYDAERRAEYVDGAVAAGQADRVADIYEGERISYGELKSASTRGSTHSPH